MAPRKGRILCTEDDEDTRDLLVLMLQSADYEVVCTDDPNKTLDLVQTEKFDLLLLDNWMPGISGEGLCKKIRIIDSQTPILFYSGAAYQEDQDRAREAGAQGYLVKPVIESELVSEIARIIAESKVAFPVSVVPPGKSQLINVGE